MIPGEFAALTRKASQTRDFTELDAAIKEKIRPYLYNNGEGRYIPSSELIHVRRYVTSYTTEYTVFSSTI